MQMSAIALKALQHGLESIEDIQGPLVPFTLVLDTNPDLKNRTMTLTRYAEELLEDSLHTAQNSILPSKEKSMYAIAWDGFVTLEGQKWDAILVEAGNADEPEGVLMAQRYEAKMVGLFSKRRRNVAVGDPIHVGSAPSRLWNAGNAAWFVRSLLRLCKNGGADAARDLDRVTDHLCGRPGEEPKLRPKPASPPSMMGR
jgi:hypothetical protein